MECTTVFGVSKLTASKGLVRINNLSIFCSSRFGISSWNTVEGIMFVVYSKLYFLIESPSNRISYLFSFFSLEKKNYNWHFTYNINYNVYRMIDALLSKEIWALPQSLWLDSYLVTIPCHTDFLLISNHCITCWKLFIDTFIFRFLIYKLFWISFCIQQSCSSEMVCLALCISLSVYVNTYMYVFLLIEPFYNGCYNNCFVLFRIEWWWNDRQGWPAKVLFSA